MMLVSLMALSTILCHAQAMIGIDLSGLLHSEVKVAFGHEVAEHWSLSAAAGVNLRTLKRQVSTEESKHQLEYPTGPKLSSVDYAHRERICIDFWPQSVFSGISVSVGGEYRGNEGFDATAGLGYMFGIWKGLTGNIRYDLGIIRSDREGKLSVQDLSIGIYWIF